MVEVTIVAGDTHGPVEDPLDRTIRTPYERFKYATDKTRRPCTKQCT
jgi:hypothetical protein